MDYGFLKDLGHVFLYLLLTFFTLIILLIACGGVFKRRFGSIASPNFPEAQSNLNCKWMISGSPINKDYIEINFNIIDINDPSDQCIHNYISFGDSINEDMLPRYCNRRRATLGFISTTSEVVIKYVTGDNVNNSSPGFDADFRIFNQSIISTTLRKSGTLLYFVAPNLTSYI